MSPSWPGCAFLMRRWSGWLGGCRGSSSMWIGLRGSIWTMWRLLRTWSSWRTCCGLMSRGLAGPGTWCWSRRRIRSRGRFGCLRRRLRLDEHAAQQRFRLLPHPSGVKVGWGEEMGELSELSVAEALRLIDAGELSGDEVFSAYVEAAA